MIKQTMGWISAICGVIGAICSGWKLMLLPVVRILNMIADKKLDLCILLVSIMKMFFAIPVAYFMILIGFSIATYCWRWWK